MKIEAWAVTDVGNVRANNEDSYLLDQEHRLFIVADGVGGSAAGEVASGHLCELVGERAEELAKLVKLGDPVTSQEHRERVLSKLLGVIQEANTEILEIGKEINPSKPSATTADVMLLAQNSAFIAHVGDSRVYLIRGKEIFRITEDHTFAEQLKHEEGVDPYVLARFKNVLTRSVGGKADVDIDALFIDLQPGDRVLMCSDGLTEYLSGTEILEHSQRHSGLELLSTMVEIAKERGGHDNITALLVEAEPGKQSESHDTLKQAVVLGQISLFEDLDLRELMRVLRAVYESSYDAGEQILCADDESQDLYIVAAGAVSVESQGKTTLYSQGGHFGEAALMVGTSHPFTVNAREDTVLLSLSPTKFRKLVADNPPMGNKLLWNLLRSAAEHIAKLESAE